MEICDICNSSGLVCDGGLQTKYFYQKIVYCSCEKGRKKKYNEKIEERARNLRENDINVKIAGEKND